MPLPDTLRPGNLVRIKRGTFGVEPGTIALIIEGFTSNDGSSSDPKSIWTVKLMNGRRLRYLTRDLEKIS